MRIGEVAEQTGLNISNIRFYEKKGLIEPDREQQSKYRDYTDADVERLKEIILCRKMDLPIETISLLIHKKISMQDAVEQQLLDLKEKQKMIQGSIDLCQKIIEDQSYEKMDVEFYLNYVRVEEAGGTKFAKIDELLNDFAEFTEFERMAGDPYVGWIFRNPSRNRIAVLLWAVMWIAIPVLGILDDGLDGNGIGPVKLLFWIGWFIFFGLNFYEFRMRKEKEAGY